MDKSVHKYKTLVTSKKIKRPLLGTFDTIICLVTLTPCVAGFWFATWTIADLHPEWLPPWPTLLITACVHLLCVLVQDFLKDLADKKVSHLVLTRLYIYVFAVTNIACWRAAWAIIDSGTGVQLGPSGVKREGSFLMTCLFAACLSGLVLLKGLRNCVSCPFVFCLDRRAMVFTIPTRFRAKMSERTSLYVLDCLFSVLVVGTLVVFVWRGAWALIDIFLFPEDAAWSAWGSLVLGYATVIIAFALQPLMKWVCDRITGVLRVLVADIFLLLSVVGTINVWRGIWNLLNLYLLPDNLELSCWITHWVCLILLVLLGCSNSLLVRGVYIDAEEPAGKCVIFPCHYLRLIFQEQKVRKLQLEQLKTELSNVKPYENNHVAVVVNHKEGDV